MIFVSDLDKTLVYSRWPGNVCVEYSEGKEVTYMTSRAVEVFREIVDCDKFTFIPCTLRSYEQTARIRLINDLKNQILICDNGFSIYRNGILDIEWDKVMSAHLCKYPNKEVLSNINQCVEANHLPVRKVKDNRSAFFTVIFDDVETAHRYYCLIYSCADERLYDFELQGRKLYVLPKFLDKSLAVDYILSDSSGECVVTAGDSEVDKEFLLRGKYKIIPAHASIQVKDAMITPNVGIKAGEDILVEVKKLMSGI